jgi:hypothetical protein
VGWTSLRSPRGLEPTTFLLLRTGWDSNPRGLSPTRFPIVRLKPLGHPSRDVAPWPALRREWDGPRFARSSRVTPFSGALRAHTPSALGSNPASQSPWVGIPETVLSLLPTEGVGFEPTRVLRPNALAGRRLKPLGHPSKADASTASPVHPELPRQGSNLDSSDPESDVLPVTPRGKRSHLSESNRRPRHYE